MKNTPPLSCWLAAMAAALFLSACGGGETSTTPAQMFVGRIAAESLIASTTPYTAMAVGQTGNAVVITNDQLFQWAQLQYPELFGTALPNVIRNLPYNGQLFDVREYARGAYLGISEGRVFGLGPFSKGALIDYGAVQSFASQVCGRINCGGGVDAGGSTGTLNGCTPPASEALRVGNRYTTAFLSEGISPSISLGEFTIDEVVEGNTIFEGQPAIKISTRIFGARAGQVFDETSTSFEQVAENELIRSLGTEAVVATNVGSYTSRTVYNPPFLGNEVTLQLGQSIDQTSSLTTTSINAPFPTPPITSTESSRITYEARETIAVLGRSYDTCRYKVTYANDNSSLYAWGIYGKGVAVLTESRSADGTLLLRNSLKSATINGVGI